MALTLQVTIDGTTVDVDVKESDFVRLEEHDREYARDLALAKQNGTDSLISPRRLYLLAWIAMARMHRRGLLDVDVPGTPDEFFDMVDGLTADDDGVDEGKASDPAPSTGS